MSLDEQIQQESERFHTLFDSLSETQWSEVALPDLKSNLKTLQTQIQSTKKKIDKFNAAANKEYKRLADIKGNGIRHIWYRVHGNLEQRLDAQQKIWLQEFEKCKEEEQQLFVLKETLNSNQQQLQQCQNTYEKYIKTKKELDSLLEHYFSGVTPSYPVEDAIEQKLEHEKQHLITLQNDYRIFKHTLELLRKAHTSLLLCNRALNDALNTNTYDLFSSSSFADMAVHSSLAKARNASAQAQQYIDEAKRFYPNLIGIGNLNIKQDNLVFNIIFDNIWTDMKMRKMIREALDRISCADKVLTNMVIEFEQKLKQYEADQKEASTNVKKMVVEHFNQRVAIVKDIIAPPPPYTTT